MIRSISLKTKTIKELQKDLDEVFSIYIRMKNADPKGMVKCFTCGKIDHWKKMQNGHYYSRRHVSLRYEEKNCEVQCVSCNVFNQGAGPAFGQALVRKHGEGILSELEIMKNRICKMSEFEYRYLIAEYKKKIESK